MSYKLVTWFVVLVCGLFLMIVFARIIPFSDIARFFYNTQSCGDSQMKLQEALEVASHGECSEKGKTFFWGATCNSYTGTWWLSYSSDKPTKCNPQCVVKTYSKQAEVNYMCVGGLNPN